MKKILLIAFSCLIPSAHAVDYVKCEAIRAVISRNSIQRQEAFKDSYDRFEMKKRKGRTEWLRGMIIKKKNLYFLTKFVSTGSGIISSISQSHGIIELDEKKEYIKKGTLLKFYRYEDLLN